jgi:SPP1 family predicted phage head-tail adaptor
MASLITPGKLDRRITVERRTATKDPIYGTSQAAWEPVATVWAQVTDVLPSKAEGVEGEIALQRRPARIRTRYRDDLTADMRIIYQGRTMEIVGGPAELGRKEGLEFVVEEISTQGDAP